MYRHLLESVNHSSKLTPYAISVTYPKVALENLHFGPDVLCVSRAWPENTLPL